MHYGTKRISNTLIQQHNELIAKSTVTELMTMCTLIFDIYLAHY